MNKNIIFNTIKIIVLGAIGSALWEFSKPLLSSLTIIVAKFSTFGFESLRDDFYAAAALSLGRPVGVGISLSIVICFISVLSASAFHVLSFSEEAKISRMAKSYMMMCFLVGFTFFAQFMRGAYVIQLANYYELLEVRAAPYTSDVEIKKIRALFAQVQTKKDFLSVIETLSIKIRAAGETLPIVP